MPRPTFFDSVKSKTPRAIRWMDDPKSWEITEKLLSKASYSDYYKVIRNFLLERGFLTPMMESVITDGRTHRGRPPVPRKYAVSRYGKEAEGPHPALLPGAVDFIPIPAPPSPDPSDLPVTLSEAAAALETILKGSEASASSAVLKEVRAKLDALKAGHSTEGFRPLPTPMGGIKLPNQVPPPPPPKPENPFDKLRHILLTQRGYAHVEQ